MNVTYDILIPAYNAQKTLPKLLDSIHHLTFKPNVIIVIDDGSTDATAQVAMQVRNVQLLRLDSNHGKGQALRTGIEEFLQKHSDSYLLMMDADGQHAVESIPEFLKLAESENYDIIIGHRSRKIGLMPISRIFSNTLSSLIVSWISGQKIWDSQCGFRLLKRSVLETVSLTETGFQIETELIVKAAKYGFSIGFVPIPTIYNGEKSYIKHVDDTVRFFKIILRELVRL